MINRVSDYFKPPEYNSIEQTQKARFLHIALLAAACSCFLLGVMNTPGKTNLNIFLFIASGTCSLCIPANKHGYYTPVAYFISGLMLVIVTYSLITGVGLMDAGIIAYPIYIIFSSYLFTKESVLPTTLLSIGSILLVYFLGRVGVHNPEVRYSDESQLNVIFVLFPTAGYLLWAVVDNWERIVKNLRDTYDVTLLGWGQALEYRDQETQGHSRRVVEMTLELAKRLGIRGGALDHIRRGALLHDIGKMGIPDCILQKKGSLSEEEWTVVKMHPIHAKRLLENIPYLKPALVIPYSHHERWNGSGYPEGLSKEAIPFAARIFAVVDAWDALTSNRPYHEAWPAEKARSYIHEQSGELFDPQVVNAFLQLLDSGENRH